MGIVDKAKQAAIAATVTKALDYLEKDPETNIPKIMEMVDKVTPLVCRTEKCDPSLHRGKGQLVSADPSYVSAGCRRTPDIFPQLYCKCQS